MRSSHLPVRDSDPATSWFAAFEQTNPTIKLRVKGAIVAALKTFGPMTHDQLVDVVNTVRPASPSGVRTRCAELVEEGLVERHPTMVAKSRYGRASLLWRVVQK